MNESLLLLVGANILSDDIDLVLNVLDLLCRLVDVVIVGPFRQELQPALSLKEFVTLDGQSCVVLRFILNLLLNLSTLILLLHLFNLHELVVDHLLGVLKYPFPDCGSVDALRLLALLRRIRLLLLVRPCTSLHGDNLFVLPLRLDVRLVLLTLHYIELTLLSCKLPLHFGFLFGLLFLNLSSVLRLLLDPLHHGDFLSLHLADLMLHVLRLLFLLGQSLRQLCLLPRLPLEFFQFDLQLGLLLLELVFDSALLRVAHAMTLLQCLILFGFEALHLSCHGRDLLVVLFSHLPQKHILHLLLLLLDLLEEGFFLAHLLAEVLLLRFQLVYRAEEIQLGLVAYCATSSRT